MKKRGDDHLFKFTKLGIPGMILIEAQKFGDNRGSLSESYKAPEFLENGIPAFNQDIISISKKNVIRGLHYQLEPMEQGKLVRVLKGRIFDVGVDIRRGSPHFGKWHGEELSEENSRILWIPKGFAHGFSALEDDSVVFYKTTKIYSKEHERGIAWNDSDINIAWPVKEPVISERDAKLPGLKEAEMNFDF